jgi:hypothetical protein
MDRSVKPERYLKTDRSVKPDRSVKTDRSVQTDRSVNDRMVLLTERFGLQNSPVDRMVRLSFSSAKFIGKKVLIFGGTHLETRGKSTL